MARTTPEAVALIIKVKSGVDLTPFIDAANELVTEACGSVSPAYTDARLEKIETWLAAHFYAIRFMRASQENASGVSASYMYRVDLGLANTQYGQQAMILDTKGGLIALQKKLTGKGGQTIGVHWLGTPPEEREITEIG